MSVRSKAPPSLCRIHPSPAECVIFKGMYVSCGRWRRREGTGQEETSGETSEAVLTVSTGDGGVEMRTTTMVVAMVVVVVVV